ncbi:hypothetical protein [Actinokineospora sp. NBRC 105648]|uniref:hypothetical protein n=1 Tax=Actinokineospora sp. NBRC 105648 TaxID=3032206 RepID=UPI0025538F16|nr:hypothetical protein [Actinokineospora sp. NBRC 105648]
MRGSVGRHDARRATRPATVWQCGGDDPCDGTTLLSGWLLKAIVKIVTGYSGPGDRVLLLAPPSTANEPARRTRVGRGRGRYDGLHEAAWAVSRLGRSVRTRTAYTPDAITDFHDDHGPRSPQSVSRPRHETDPTHLPDRTRPGSDSSATSSSSVSCSDTFDVVITAAPPDHTDWTRHVDWTGLLAPRGIAAVITHSENSGHRLIDPTTRLVRTLSECGWAWLDHVILLEKLLTPHHETSTPALARSRRVHHDLLLFARPAGPAADHETTGGEDRDA